MTLKKMEIPKLSLFWQYLEYWAKKDSNFPSIRYINKILTAGELHELTDKLAMAFLDYGLKKGDTIVTILPTIPEFVLTFMAANKIGVITIPMDKEYKKADFKRLIPQSSPKIIITLDKWQNNKIADNLQELKEEFGDIQFIIVGNHDLGIKFEKLMVKEYHLEKELKKVKESQRKEDCMLVIWTGGTTGFPKAVELTNLNVIEMCFFEYQYLFNIFTKLDVIKETSRIKFLVNLPVSHVGGTIELLGTGILGGLEMILQASWSPWDSLKAMKLYKLPFMGGVPTMFKIFLSIPDLDNYEPKKYIKLVLISGEKCSLELLMGIKERICNNITIGYGSTEAGSEVTFTDLNDEIEKIAEGYVGKPLPGMEIIIGDENGKELTQGEKGEILVKGPLTSKSYFRMPEEDKVGFTTDGYCKTGDLGYLDKNGGLYIVGRIKEIIRVGGYTVIPAEIEELVLSHPKVAIVAAIGAPDEIHGEVVWLVIGPELGKKFEKNDEKEILEMCKKNLAKFKVPKKIIVYPLDPNDLPITRIGKVDKVRLKKELLTK